MPTGVIKLISDEEWRIHFLNEGVVITYYKNGKTLLARSYKVKDERMGEIMGIEVFPSSLIAGAKAFITNAEDNDLLNRHLQLVLQLILQALRQTCSFSRLRFW